MILYFTKNKLLYFVNCNVCLGLLVISNKRAKTSNYYNTSYTKEFRLTKYLENQWQNCLFVSGWVVVIMQEKECYSVFAIERQA